MSEQEFTARIHEDDDGSIWAEVLELPGCFASGRSLDELREALEEALSMYLHDVAKGGVVTGLEPEPMRKPAHMAVDEMRVKVPA
jgi:predicted RNase H-like HicB family nuclease